MRDSLVGDNIASARRGGGAVTVLRTIISHFRESSDFDWTSMRGLRHGYVGGSLISGRARVRARPAASRAF